MKIALETRDINDLVRQVAIETVAELRREGDRFGKLDGGGSAPELERLSAARRARRVEAGFLLQGGSVTYLRNRRWRSMAKLVKGSSMPVSGEMQQHSSK